MSDILDLSNVDLAAENIGETWLNFQDMCTEYAAIQFRDAYNLINITFPENFLDVEITNILIDESIETSDRIMKIRQLFIFNLISCLQEIGVVIDMEYVDPNSLKDLIYIMDSFYTFDQMDDLLGLVDILDDELIDTKERLIQVLTKLDPSVDTENFCYLIKEVAPNVTKGLMVGLNIIPDDDTEYMEPSLKRRVIANKPFLKGSLAEQHVKNDGGVGLDIEVLMNLFINELGQKLINNQEEYLKEVLGLLIIANVTDSQLHSQYLSMVEQLGLDIKTVYKAQNLLEEVILDEQV